MESIIADVNRPVNIFINIFNNVFNNVLNCDNIFTLIMYGVNDMKMREIMKLAQTRREFLCDEFDKISKTHTMSEFAQMNNLSIARISKILSKARNDKKLLEL